MKIQRVAMAMIIVFLTFYLLHLGQTLLLPLVIAGAIAYLISILAHAITKLAYKGFSCPSHSRCSSRSQSYSCRFLI